MAYDVNKLVKLQGLKDLATQVKTELAALSTRIDDIVSTGGEPNVITSVKVNGTALAIAEKAVDILVATGKANGTLAVNGVDVAIKGLAALAYKAQVSQADLDAALQAVLGNIVIQLCHNFIAVCLQLAHGRHNGVYLLGRRHARFVLFCRFFQKGAVIQRAHAHHKKFVQI